MKLTRAFLIPTLALATLAALAPGQGQTGAGQTGGATRATPGGGGSSSGGGDL